MTSIVYDELAEGAQYDNFRFDVMKTVWSPEKNPYLNINEVPWIGTGFNMASSEGELQVIYEAIFGTVDPRDTTLIPDLWDVVSNTPYTAGQNGALRNDLKAVLAEHGIGGHFVFANQGQMQTALETLGLFAESSLSWSDQDLPYSQERAAVFSVAFEGVDVSNILQAMIENDDRFRAWFELRYDSNDASGAGAAEKRETAARRYEQSDFFELYNNPNNVDYDEAFDVARGYQNNRNAILAYEAKYDPEAAGNGAGAAAAGGRGGNINDALQPAIAAILEHFNISGVHVEDVLYARNGSPNLVGDVTGFDSKKNDDDLLIGDGEDNTIVGGQGNDVILGLGGDDNLTGGLDNDRVFGYSGRDILNGALGNDMLDGGADNDRLLGGDGNDRLFGSSGSDRLDGGIGNDTLDGGNDRDTLVGGAGDDRLDAGYGNDIVDGDDGRDNLTGLDGNDRLDGGADDDRLDGGNDDDILIGAAGKDKLFGGAGLDRLDGGSGNDLLDGGNDRDTLVGGAGDDRLDAGYGNDIVDGGDGNDRLIGFDGDDRLDGGKGNDDLNGGNDADILTGGLGNDRLEGAGGIDMLRGGEGDDTYVLLTNNAANTHPDPDVHTNPDPDPGPDPDPDPTGNPSLAGGNNTDEIVEEKNAGTDTVVIGIAGNFDIRNVEKLRLTGDISGNVSVTLNQFDIFTLTDKADTLTLTINKLQKEAIDIVTGGGADTIRIDLAPGIDPSQVLDHKGLTARFDFADLSANDTIDLTSIGIKKIVANDLDISSDKGFYLMAPDAKIHLMDGGEEIKTYNNDTNSWFVVKCGDDTPYGPEFLGNVTKDNFDI
ncbi:MAG: hypothetical protein JWM58_2619 [Rhizobium sp.]|nr:hypothetical protein [Rhizobium sp.]